MGYLVQKVAEREGTGGASREEKEKKTAGANEQDGGGKRKFDAWEDRAWRGL